MELSLRDMAIKMAELAVIEVTALHNGLDRAAQLIEKTAKAEIGTYQDEAGPFPAWAPLSDATETEKAKSGYPVDSPLLRTGEMRDSIKHETDGLEAIVGATDKKMEYHEFGTNTIPARPVIGPAAYRNKEKIKKLLGTAAVEGILGKTSIHPSLGYDFDVSSDR